MLPWHSYRAMILPRQKIAKLMASEYRMKRHLLLVAFTFFILWRIEEGKTRNPTAAWIPVSTYTDLAQCQQKSTELNKNKPAQHPRRYVCLPDTIQPPAPT